jgi:hypothetical protein
MKQIYLVEDHDEVLTLWQKARLRGCDLVHFDAHIDFAPHQALSAQQACLQAGSVRELKEKLEYSLAYSRYEKKLDKQTDIGNYIYAAMQRDIVRDFYWVIPGSAAIFAASIPGIKNIFRNLHRKVHGRAAAAPKIEIDRKRGSVRVRILDRLFTACCLDSLPNFRYRNVLVDIDADFLVIERIADADSTQAVGKRKLWVSGRALAAIAARKIPDPRMLTIAYSVNGGFTPMRYRYVADEVAFYLAPDVFKRRYLRRYQAGMFFNRFLDAGESGCYRKAAVRDAYYRCPDNNYGPLYLEKNKTARAREEFAKVHSADPENPGSLWGLGECALRARDHSLARRYLRKALLHCRGRMFGKLRPVIMYSLAFAEYGAGGLPAAQRLLERYRRMKPLDPRGYYWLGVICQKRRCRERAIRFYYDSVRLGYAGIDPVCRLAKIVSTGSVKSDIISFVSGKVLQAERTTARLLKLRRTSVLQRRVAARELIRLKRAGVLLQRSNV